MEASIATGSCLEHAERQGTPCRRCGTFRCEACLSDGYCARCRGAVDLVRPVQVEDTYGFGRRAGGRLIDLLGGQMAAFAGGILAAILLIVLQALGLARPGWETRLEHGFGFTFISATVATLVAAAVSCWIGGASLGKALLGMRVVRTDGRRAGLAANLTREVGYLVDALFFGFVGKAAMESSPLQQRNGDRFAGTTVVRASALSHSTAYSTPRVLVGVAVGLAVQSIVLGLFLALGSL